MLEWSPVAVKGLSDSRVDDTASQGMRFIKDYSDSWQVKNNTCHFCKLSNQKAWQVFTETMHVQQEVTA